MNNDQNSMARLADEALAGILKEPKQEKAPYRLSQSLIKELLDFNDCPLRVKTHSIDNTYNRPETVTLIKGQYFEWLALGNTNREGRVPELPYVGKSKKNPNGRPSTDEVRIKEQAAVFWQQMEDWGIEVLDRDVPIKLRYTDELQVDGIIDIRARINGEPYIVDVKLTADVNSTFGFYGFGSFETMDKIQADMYCMIEERTLGFRPGFAYAVFDYKKNPERKLFFVDRDFIRETTLHERIEESLETIKENDRKGWEARPNYSLCQTKCGNLTCPHRVHEKPQS